MGAVGTFPKRSQGVRVAAEETCRPFRRSATETARDSAEKAQEWKNPMPLGQIFRLRLGFVE